MILFNAIDHLYAQQPLIFWAAIGTVVFAACAAIARVGIKCGARDWLADDPVEAESSISYDDAKSLDLITKQLPSFATPAVKGFTKPLSQADREAIVWDGFEKMRGARR